MSNRVYIVFLCVVIVFMAVLASFNNIERFSVTYCNTEDIPSTTPSLGCVRYAPSTASTVRNITSGSAKSFRVRKGFSVTPYTHAQCSNGKINTYKNEANSDVTINFNKLQQDATNAKVSNFAANGVKCILVENLAASSKA